MERVPPAPQKRGLTAIDGALALVAVLLIVQMWLLTATLNAFLGGDQASVLPGTFLSGLIFLACLGLYLFIRQVDASVRRS